VSLQDSLKQLGQFCVLARDMTQFDFSKSGRVYVTTELDDLAHTSWLWGLSALLDCRGELTILTTCAQLRAERMLLMIQRGEPFATATIVNMRRDTCPVPPRITLSHMALCWYDAGYFYLNDIQPAILSSSDAYVSVRYKSLIDLR